MSALHLGKGQLTNLRERLRSSLWFVPALACVGALALATGAVVFDRRVLDNEQPWFLLGRDAASARDLVNTIASSMFTFTGIVFSITILVLQLTSQQYSSRVLRTFLRDRPTQIALATFTATFTFALRVLPAVDAQREFVPATSVTILFVLVLASVGVFLQYLDHMAHALRIVSIVARTAAEGRRSLDRHFPDPLREYEPPPARPAGAATRTDTNGDSPGVVTAIHVESLLEVACDHDVVLEVLPMMGTFVPREKETFRIWGERPPPRDQLAEMLAIGLERTPDADPLFAFRELVDIAERALSPGINDPTTAVQVLDAIHDLLRTLVTRAFPSPALRDRAGRVRVILHEPTWELFVHVALDEIRQYGVGSVQVARKLRAILDDLLELAPPDRRAPLEEQQTLLDASVERGFHSGADRRHARRETADETSAAAPA